MVSKKSDSMMEKTKTSSVGLTKTLTIAMPEPSAAVWNGAMKVVKSGSWTMPVGIGVTPRGTPATAAMMMPHRM